jgi:hypothetical protein
VFFVKAIIINFRNSNHLFIVFFNFYSSSSILGLATASPTSGSLSCLFVLLVWFLLLGLRHRSWLMLLSSVAGILLFRCLLFFIHAFEASGASWRSFVSYLWHYLNIGLWNLRCSVNSFLESGWSLRSWSLIITFLGSSFLLKTTTANIFVRKSISFFYSLLLVKGFKEIIKVVAPKFKDVTGMKFLVLLLLYRGLSREF